MKTYVLIGDSQAVGLRDPLREAMNRRGYREQGAAAHVGWNTRRMVESGEAQLLPAADLAIVVLGGNDTVGQRLERAIQVLVQQIRQRTQRILWIGPAHAEPADIAARKREVARLQAQMARRLGFAWIDGLPMTAGLGHQPDGLHFREDALGRWAQRIASKVSSGGSVAVRWASGAVLLAAGLWLWLRSN